MIRFTIEGQGSKDSPVPVRLAMPGGDLVLEWRDRGGSWWNLITIDGKTGTFSVNQSARGDGTSGFAFTPNGKLQRAGE